MLNERIKSVRWGLLLAIGTLLFGIVMGVAFGVVEDTFKDWIKASIGLYPELHDSGSASKTWRYAQRAHFHATGVGAFTLGMIVLLALTNLRPQLKSVTAVLIGLGGLYPLAWLSIFLYSPSMGRGPAHEALATLVPTYAGVACLLVGFAILMANLFLGVGGETEATARGSVESPRPTA